MTDEVVDCTPSSNVVSKGRNGKRSKSGCKTCRTKKVKCDENRPLCHRCLRLGLFCTYEDGPKGGAIPDQSAKRNIDNQSGSKPGLMLLVGEKSQNPKQLWIPTSQTLNTRLPGFRVGANGLELSSQDHEAIRYFRNTVARTHYSKDPTFSLYSIILIMAEKYPMIMHVVLALGGRQMEAQTARDPGLAENRELLSLHHYSAALSLMAEAIGDNPSRSADIDALLAALLVMLEFEEKYGDAKCSGLLRHLGGAAMIIQQRYQNLGLLIKSSTTMESPESLLDGGRGVVCSPTSDLRTRNEELPTYLTAQILVSIAWHDVAAASYGLGGRFYDALYESLSIEGTPPPRGLNGIHRFSLPLYRTVWGDSYPQSELIDDLENAPIYSLLDESIHIRFMITQMVKAPDRTEFLRQANLIEHEIRQVNEVYSEILRTAEALTLSTDNSRRLVVNIRCIMPHHYAGIVQFLGLVGDSLGPKPRQEQVGYVQSIMNLAFQAFKYDGDESIIRIAWPLFVVALHTNDLLHQDWIMSRFQSISRYGHNFQRAYRYLAETLPLQVKLSRQVDIRKRFGVAEVELFVL